MATLSKKKNLHSRWKELVTKISSDRPVDRDENEYTKRIRIQRAQADYDFFVTYYFPHYTQNKLGEVTHCAPFHIDGANTVRNTPNYKGIWEIFRGGAKSTHVDIFLPLWLKIQEPRQINVMMLVGKNHKTAVRLLQDIQAELAANPRYIHDFGEQVKLGSWEQGEFVTNDGCAFVALGMGEPPRGTRFGANRPDYIACDDLDDDKLKKNPARIREAVDWLYRAVIPTMDIGIARFILVNNRITKTGILSTVVAERPEWHHLLVNALDENGKPTWGKYTEAYFDQLKKDVGWKAFQTEYMNDPQEDAGVFTREAIQWKKMPNDWTQFDAIVMYGDMSYSTSKKSDYTAIKCWAKKGVTLNKLKAYLRQTETPAQAIDWWFRFYLSLPKAVQLKMRCYVEANATQRILLKPIIDAAAKRYGVTNFIKFDLERKGDKADRIGSMTTQYHNGDVFYDISQLEDPDMIASVEQLTGWEEGARYDDGPDADQSAHAKLVIIGRLSGRGAARTGAFVKNNSRGF
ncbi:hypothetical protein [Hymenobacter sp. B81]|uniref:hypothetical protein n=1 Tax=Hymenobacter sp. B81 TaxID=3344878 RepID=UPI0037DD6E5F